MRQAKCDQTQSAHAGNSRTSQMKRRVVRRCSGIDEIMKIPPYRVTSICALHDAWSVPEHVILHRHAIPIITIAPVAWPHMHMRSSHLLFGLCSPCGVRTCLLQTLAKKANLTSAPRKIQIISHDLQVYFPLNQAFDSISAPFWQAWEPALLWSFPEYLSTPYLATGREFLERSSRVLHHALRTQTRTSVAGSGVKRPGAFSPNPVTQNGRHRWDQAPPFRRKPETRARMGPAGGEGRLLSLFIGLLFLYSGLYLLLLVRSLVANEC